MNRNRSVHFTYLKVAIYMQILCWKVSGKLSCTCVDNQEYLNVIRSIMIIILYCIITLDFTKT